MGLFWGCESQQIRASPLQQNHSFIRVGAVSSLLSLTRVVFHHCSLSSGCSFIRVLFRCLSSGCSFIVFHQGAFSLSFIRVLFHCLSSGCSFIVFHQGAFSSLWSFIRVLFHHCGLSSGCSFIIVVFYWHAFSSLWSFISVLFHHCGLSSGCSFIIVVFYQCSLASLLSFTRVVFYQGGVSWRFYLGSLSLAWSLIQGSANCILLCLKETLKGKLLWRDSVIHATPVLCL